MEGPQIGSWTYDRTLCVRSFILTYFCPLCFCLSIDTEQCLHQNESRLPCPDHCPNVPTSVALATLTSALNSNQLSTSTILFNIQLFAIVATSNGAYVFHARNAFHLLKSTKLACIFLPNITLALYMKHLDRLLMNQWHKGPQTILLLIMVLLNLPLKTITLLMF